MLDQHKDGYLMAKTVIEAVGFGKAVDAFIKYRTILTNHLKQAGEQAAEEILDTQGLRSYPEATAANQPPTPYYIRGRGTQYASGNAGNSERYGSQWTVQSTGYVTTMQNRASYASHLGGSRQVRWAGLYGWRKLHQVGKEKVSRVIEIVTRWAERARTQAGL